MASVLPEQITAVVGAEPTLRVRDEEVKAGDLIDYAGRADGERSQATVDRIIRVWNPSDEPADSGWIVEATTGMDSANPGQRVLLTHSRVNDIHLLAAPDKVGGSPATADTSPQVPATGLEDEVSALGCAAARC